MWTAGTLLLEFSSATVDGRQGLVFFIILRTRACSFHASCLNSREGGREERGRRERMKWKTKDVYLITNCPRESVKDVAFFSADNRII